MPTDAPAKPRHATARSHPLHATASPSGTVTAKAKAKPATWRDWAPTAPDPTQLVTRQELIADLRANGLPVTSNQVRYWQQVGLLPHPVRHRKGQGVHAFYPPWVADLIHELVALQAEGRKRDDMRPILRARAGELAGVGATPGNRFTVPTAEATGSAPPPTLVAQRTVPTSTAISVAVPDDDLARHVAAFAHAYGQQVGTRIVGAEVRLIDDRGHPFTFDVPMPPLPTGNGG